MARTHSFEIEVNGNILEGEFDVSDASDVMVTFGAGVEMQASNLLHLVEILKKVNCLCKDCGPIKRIEIAVL